MQEAFIGHIMIGIPGSGKSTFATQLASLGNYQVISTDQIRQQLYGDERIQGKWEEIEKEVLANIQAAIAQNQPVIYDATNTKRCYRMILLHQLKAMSSKVQWMGWYLQTPLPICLQWNQQRQRQVPVEIIENMFYSLENSPPILAEGFIDICSLDLSDPNFNVTSVITKIADLSRRLINHHNDDQIYRNI